jgi:hypothetical protein
VVVSASSSVHSCSIQEASDMVALTQYSEQMHWLFDVQREAAGVS